MGLFDRLITGTRQAPVSDSGVRAPQFATQNVRWSTPGIPQEPDWNAQSAVEGGYYSNVYVMRGVRVIADALASLPFRAGLDPQKPMNFNPEAPLAQLLGPAPGGPNITTSARALWAWSIVQRLVTGKFGWEYDFAQGSQTKIVGLWPLVSSALYPIPSSTPGVWFDSFEYRLAGGVRKPMPATNLFYSWRPSARDWRQPESPLESASLAILMANALERYNWSEARNGFSGGTVVTTPPFETAADRRTFQDQFLSEFTGFDNAGKTAFAEFEPGEDASGKPGPMPSLQVARIAQTNVDAQTLALAEAVEEKILRALGVPMSMVGDASQRTWENADQEHRNFWTGPVLDLARELQDDININLAPRLGDELGWFDFSKVEALRPPQVFAQLTPDLALQAGLIVREDWRNDVGLPPLPGDAPANTDEELPAVEDTPGSSGGSSSGGSGGSSGGGRVDSDTLTSTAVDPKEVHDYLATNYPNSTLGWVQQAQWTRQRVPLDQVAMRARPGGRDDAKTQAIAAAIEDGKTMDPVVLVNTPDPDAKLKVADGYHRTKATERAGRKTIDAYVGQVPDERGPWDTEMHDAKLNRDAVMESGTAGLLLPKGPIAPHLYRKGTNGCKICGCSAGAIQHVSALHQVRVVPRARQRHAGRDHAPVKSGHVTTAREHALATARTVSRHADTVEPQAEQVMRSLFGKQQKAVVSRLTGRRGLQMLRAAAAAQNPDSSDSGEPDPAAPVDPAFVFDQPYWQQETVDALGNVYSTVSGLTVDRMATSLHPDEPQPGAVQSVSDALTQRAQTVAAQINSTTYGQIADQLSQGLANGEHVGQLATRVRGVFEQADQTRATMIARTEAIGALNQAAQSYAAALPTGMVAYKQWLAVDDPRTRPMHRAADGQQQNLGDPFIVGGFPMQHPGDPTAPPDEVINCRCTTAYVPRRLSTVRAGFDPNEPRIAGKWAKSADVEAARQKDISRHASRVLRTAQKNEPRFTVDAKDVADRHDAQLTGLDHRVKTGKSLRRKIGSDMTNDKVDARAAADKLADVNRYTAVLPENRYSSGATAIVKDLRDQGHTVRVKNFWADPKNAYQGINLQVGHRDGGRFELQLHTPASLAAKQPLHDVYELRRDPSSTPEQIRGYDVEMHKIGDKIPVPRAAKYVS